MQARERSQNSKMRIPTADRLAANRCYKCRRGFYGVRSFSFGFDFRCEQCAHMFLIGAGGCMVLEGT